MYNIARKNTLGIHLKRFQKEFPSFYNFFPQTWLFPSDFHEITEYFHKKHKQEESKEKETGKKSAGTKSTKNQV